MSLCLSLTAAVSEKWILTINSSLHTRMTLPVKSVPRRKLFVLNEMLFPFCEYLFLYWLGKQLTHSLWKLEFSCFHRSHSVVLNFISSHLNLSRPSLCHLEEEKGGVEGRGRPREPDKSLEEPQALSGSRHRWQTKLTTWMQLTIEAAANENFTGRVKKKKWDCLPGTRAREQPLF